MPRALRKARPDHRLPPSLAPLFLHFSLPLLLIDHKHKLVGINSAASELTDLRPEQACGRDWRQLFGLERSTPGATRQHAVERCLNSRRHQPLASDTMLARSGRRTPVTGHVLALEDNAGPFALLWLEQPQEAAALPHDASRAGHEMLLQHISRLHTVSELATGIAHEINQPLSAIMSFNQAARRLLAEDAPDIDRAAEALAEAVNQTRRAAGILERLRAFVGRRDLELGPVAVNQVVINSLTLLSSKLVAAGVRVSLHTEPCSPVRADALQLEQVMVNLVRNAVEAMETAPPDARLLKVDTHVRGGRVHVSVTDSGPGLSADVLDQLFSRFFTTKADGMGLGLSISRTILEAAGGELSAGNAAGGGACFRFSLPAFSTEETAHGSFAI